MDVTSGGHDGGEESSLGHKIWVGMRLWYRLVRTFVDVSHKAVLDE
jgi:hypothetical protein